ncbi:cytochrome oxidase [Prochlorococcus marinus]|uniref:cytochrome oxidase n=1 Tax=Prochlorococcus marinus TaxID=1219 RepID=UPI0022B3CA07|nr:cytochrome oxidase [Prochlorococcus marinus]
MPLKKKPAPVPWEVKEGDDKYLEEPWILKKGKEFITIETDNNNRGNIFLQKDDEKRLSLSALQAKLTYHQLLEFGYKLQKPKRKKSKTKAISDNST